MTTTTTAARTILALDLGKYKSVAYLYTGDPATATFLTFVTDCDRLHKLVAKHRPDAVVIEACLLAGEPNCTGFVCRSTRSQCRLVRPVLPLAQSRNRFRGNHRAVVRHRRHALVVWPHLGLGGRLARALFAVGHVRSHPQRGHLFDELRSSVLNSLFRIRLV